MLALLSHWQAPTPMNACVTYLTLDRLYHWAEALVKIAIMTLTIKLDGSCSSCQLANNTPPLSVTGSVIASSAMV